MYAKIDPVQVFPSVATVLFINNVAVRPGVSAYEYTALQIGVTITEIVEPAAVAAAPVDPVDPAVV